MPMASSGCASVAMVTWPGAQANAFQIWHIMSKLSDQLDMAFLCHLTRGNVFPPKLTLSTDPVFVCMILHG